MDLSTVDSLVKSCTSQNKFGVPYFWIMALLDNISWLQISYRPSGILVSHWHEDPIYYLWFMSGAVYIEYLKNEGVECTSLSFCLSTFVWNQNFITFDSPPSPLKKNRNQLTSLPAIIPNIQRICITSNNTKTTTSISFWYLQLQLGLEWSHFQGQKDSTVIILYQPTLSFHEGNVAKHVKWEQGKLCSYMKSKKYR